MSEVITYKDEIDGAVDGLHAATKAFGWVLDRLGKKWGDATSINLSVEKDGVEVKIAVTRHRRGDLAGNSPNNLAGFTVELKSNAESIDWVSGRLRVIATMPTGVRTAIKFARLFKDSVIHQLVAETLSTDLKAKNLFLALSKSGTVSENVRNISRLSANELGTSRKWDQSTIGSSVLLPVGLASPDGSALLGYEGQIFLTGGSNNVQDLFDQNRSSLTAQEVAEKWCKLFEARQKILRAKALTYVQIIIPEKISVLAELSSLAIKPPSLFLSKIEQGLEGMKVATYYLSCYSLLRSLWKEGQVSFSPADTHLNERGAFELFKSITCHLGLRRPITPGFEESNLYWVGDLSLRFSGYPLLNRRSTPVSDEISKAESELTLVSKKDPASGHIGKVRVWHNPNAIYKLKVVAFANSFFEIGSTPRTLSWWFVRYFAEFHFVWSPELQIDYLENVHADVVVCQTIERFLPRLAVK